MSLRFCCAFPVNWQLKMLYNTCHIHCLHTGKGDHARFDLLIMSNLTCFDMQSGNQTSDPLITGISTLPPELRLPHITLRRVRGRKGETALKLVKSQIFQQQAQGAFPFPLFFCFSSCALISLAEQTIRLIFIINRCLCRLNISLSQKADFVGHTTKTMDTWANELTTLKATQSKDDTMKS